MFETNIPLSRFLQFGPIQAMMGATDEFNYAHRWPEEFDARLGDCYNLAFQAFVSWSEPAFHLDWAGVWPEPVTLVHGSWHHRDEPRRINHAWVLLADGRVWEPITMTLCDRDLFDLYTRAEYTHQYSATEVFLQAVIHGTVGPWEGQSDE